MEAVGIIRYSEVYDPMGYAQMRGSSSVTGRWEVYAGSRRPVVRWGGITQVAVLAVLTTEASRLPRISWLSRPSAVTVCLLSSPRI
jgi:hypothetical protein